jgi:hypothetical protein
VVKRADKRCPKGNRRKKDNFQFINQIGFCENRSPLKRPFTPCQFLPRNFALCDLGSQLRYLVFKALQVHVFNDCRHIRPSMSDRSS